jgi:hypothetical protein
MSVREQRFILYVCLIERGVPMDKVLVFVFAGLCVLAFMVVRSIIRLLYKVIELCDHVIRREDAGEVFRDETKKAEQLE